jgi:Carboxypeptidase regulatory-like domain
MRIPARLVVVSLVAFTISIEAQTPAPSDASTGLIVGQVVDGDSGRPVGGAIASISGIRPASGGGATLSPPSRVITTSDGRFVFRDLPRGSFGITASKPGYGAGAYGRRRPNGLAQQVSLAEGERTADVVIRIWKHGAISGTVVDEAGEPLINALVRAYRRGTTMGTRYFQISSMAVTDDRGMYRLIELQPGEYIVAVVTRHISMPVSIAGTPQGSGVVFTPELMGLAIPRPGGSTTIQIGGVVYALGAGGLVPPPPAGERMFVYGTTYHPAASAAAQATVIALGSGEERSAIDFQLVPVPAARVSGSASGPEGPTAAPLRLVPADAQEVNIEQDALSTLSDRQGNFTFPAVPSGNYSLRAGGRPRAPSRPGEADGMMWTDTPVTVGRDDIVNLHVVFQPGLRISGRFEFEGGSERPAPARIQAVPLLIEPASPGGSASVPSPAARPDGSGRFTSVGLVPGKYFVRIVASPEGWRFKTATHEGRDVADLPLDLRSDATVVITFTDRWTSVRGAVTSPQGERDRDASVVLFPIDVQQWSHYGATVRRLKSVHVSRAGEYAFASVPEGEYYLVAIPDKDAGDWQDPKFLESLTRVATRINVGDGEAKTQDLRTQEVR